MKSSFGSQNKKPILNRKIRNLMISRSLLFQSIHRLIKHYSILVIIQMSQYITYWRVTISDWPILTLWWVETVTAFSQILCFGELINRFWKSSPNLEHNRRMQISGFARFLSVIWEDISDFLEVLNRGVDQLTGSLTGLSRSLQFLPTGIGISTSRR